jgi:hypothetical protein
MNATKFDRADAISRIVADNLNHDGGGMEAWFESILRTGFKGYENMTDDELAAELVDLGLADRWQAWSVIYKLPDEHLLPQCIKVAAKDVSEAERLCEQHNPGCEVLWTFQGEESEAFADYWGE